MHWLTESPVFWGREGVMETVEGAKAEEALSWHCAGNELVLGEGDSLPGSIYQSKGTTA